MSRFIFLVVSLALFAAASSQAKVRGERIILTAVLSETGPYAMQIQTGLRAPSEASRKRAKTSFQR